MTTKGQLFPTRRFSDLMHSNSIEKGDSWLRDNLNDYAVWAQTHNSLLIVTFDEDNNREGNRIPTIFVGQMVQPGEYGEYIDRKSTRLNSSHTVRSYAVY